MKSAITILLLIGSLAAAAMAQSKASYRLPVTADSAVDENLVSVNQKLTDATGTHFTITNHYSQPITALLLISADYDEVGRQRGEGNRIIDPFINRGVDQIIQPNATQVVTIGMPNTKQPNTARAELAAIVFEDGKTNGEPQAVQLILNMRQKLAKSLQTAIRVLSQAQLTGANAETAIAQLKQADIQERTATADSHLRPVVGLPFFDAERHLSSANESGGLTATQSSMKALVDQYTGWLSTLQSSAQ